MNFIEKFMEASDRSESPKSFWFWSALAAISAVAKRNVWIPRPTWTTYPNIFVFLVADSGMRKGVPINLAKELVTLVDNTRVISGRSSIQGIFTILGTAYTKPDGTVVDKAHAFIVASEFSSSIVRDPDALTHLTDLYDSCYHDKWDDVLRGGKVRLIEPSITILAGINPPHFEDFISQKDIEGGFVGRMMLIFESQKAAINPAIRKSEFKPLNKVELVKTLREIAKLHGEMLLEEEAIKFYEDWYIDFEKQRMKTKVHDRTGAINRIGEHIIKVSMLLALSRVSTTITKVDVDVALQICLNTLSNVNKITAGQGKSQYAPQTKAVIASLLNSNGYELSRQKMLSRNLGSLDATDLDRVMDTLIQGEIVEMFRRGNELVYKLTAKALKHIDYLERMKE